MTTKEAILNIINTRQGVKSVNLALDVMSLTNPISFDDIPYQKELAELVKSGEIIELEYILPDMDYRVKSIYFPKGTKFCEK